MIRFYPIDAGITFDCAKSELLSFNWRETTADFLVPDNIKQLLRVSFQSDAIVRILDEFPLSTESDPATWQGHVPHHFAYRVEGAAFESQQSSTWLEVAGPVNHFQFLTANGCLDVLTSSTPQFSIVTLPLPIPFMEVELLKPS
jgi:hypothetical protein